MTKGLISESSWEVSGGAGRKSTTPFLPLFCQPLPSPTTYNYNYIIVLIKLNLCILDYFENK